MSLPDHFGLSHWKTAQTNSICICIMQASKEWSWHQLQWAHLHCNREWLSKVFKKGFQRFSKTFEVLIVRFLKYFNAEPYSSSKLVYVNKNDSMFFVYFFSLEELKSSYHGKDSKAKPWWWPRWSTEKSTKFDIMDKSVFEIQFGCSVCFHACPWK